MSPYLPHLPDLLAALVTWAISAVLCLAGSGLTARSTAPEIQIAAGWGALCLVLTAWGVFVPLSLRVPAIAFAFTGIGVLLLPRRRPSAAAWAALCRMLVISLPLWLVMAAIRPSQPDTFLNLLPNAFYLVDYGRLPTAALPASSSLLPAAPYNTQFLSFLGSLLDPDYPPPGMSLINVMLQLVAALAMARALSLQPVSSEAAPGWGLTAAGFLLATLLNPGFVPRIHFAAYGEAALAAMAVLAAWLFVAAQGEAAGGIRAQKLWPLALVLAAIVNIKQTGFGLVAALAGAALISTWAERGVPRTATLRDVAFALLPAMFLYAVWRYHVANAGVAELTPLAFAEWHWTAISTTGTSAIHVILGKPTYFGCVTLALLVLPLLLSRQGWTAATRLLMFNAALFVLYNIFIFLTYIAAFPTEMSVEAHSYFRYNTHLSLVLVLALALAARDLGVAVWLQRRRLWIASAAVLVVAGLAPIAFAKRLRFDLDMPQPLVWDLAKKLSGYLTDGDRLALLLPGDNGSVATMLAGVLADTPPRLKLDLLRRNRSDPAVLDEAAQLGYPLALISCTPAAWKDVPPSEAALLRQSPGGWRPLAVWPYPPDAGKRRWQHILAWGPLCRTQ